MRRWIAAAAAVLAVLPPCARAQTPPAEVSLAINAPGSGNWPVYIAEQQGFFREEGLHLTIVVSGSNTNTINLVTTGGTNLALDGTDIELEAIAHGLPIRIIAPEFGPNPYTLVAAPGIADWNALKGKTIVLGAKQDISSITFFKLAEAQHLKPDDFSVINSPSSSSRYAALLSGNAQATVLSQPFDILAAERGFRALAVASDAVKSWADTCFAVNTTWAATPANHAAAVHFVRALRKAIRYGYAHQDAAVSALVAATNIAAATAAKAYDVDFRQRRVFDPDQRIDRGGVTTMAAMLVQSKAIAAMPRLDDAIDASYVAEAAR